MIDVHSHILTALDDGVKTLHDSVETIRGLSHLVATPHFYPGRYTPSYESIRVAAAAVSEAVKKHGLSIEILCGRECFLDFELTTSPDRETFPFLWKGRKYQLIELPQITLPAALSSYLK